MYSLYLGSVRFFKHLIYLLLASIVFVTGWGVVVVATRVVTSVARPDIGAIAQTAEPSVVRAKLNSLTGSLPQEAAGELLPPAPSSPDYQRMYPKLYGGLPERLVRAKKTAYLTFDDGPSARTLEILDILREHDIKATFFVVTAGADPDILRRIIAEGHTLGIHSATHRYNEIYASVDAFLEDFYAAHEAIRTATGFYPTVFRFPGGSINAYNIGIYQELIAEMLRRGFVYFDWNASAADVGPNVTAAGILDGLARSLKGQERLIVLAHDSHDKYQTVAALPQIIALLQHKGYSFDRLDSRVAPIVFAYPRPSLGPGLDI
ncbi:MAG: polysaccharide deacetylase family protein [Limnochordia bacterium]|jgi:peptidoglycan/xylan/chitin deacetylase (PgdA/CDA1 family)